MVAFASCTPQAPHAQARQGNSDRQVGGRYEGCDWYAQGMPAQLQAETTIAGPDEAGERLTINGTIFQKDGRTPAEGVILYLYHTDAAAKYSPGKHQTQAKEHGRLRGWVKTGAEWKYVFHTILPAS
jgi:protocatechuate 3,4-dioxygenase beta subunit